MIVFPTLYCLQMTPVIPNLFCHVKPRRSPVALLCVCPIFKGCLFYPELDPIYMLHTCLFFVCLKLQMTKLLIFLGCLLEEES